VGFTDGVTINVRVRHGKTRSENALKKGQAECSSGVTILVSRSGVQTLPDEQEKCWI
jgi:hypothetical protein